MQSDQRSHVFDIPIDDISLSESVSRSEAFLRDGGFHQVVTPGPEFILESLHHPAFKEVLQRSALSIPDGMGLKVGSLLRGPRIHHRVAGVDYVYELMRVAARGGYSVFFLGAKPGVAEQAYEQLKKDFPNLRLAGTDPMQRGWWGRVPDHRLVERIHFAKPDILLVALGFPRQELWIDQHREALHDVTIAVGVGRTLDYFAGAIQRPPKMLRLFGLEWLGTFFGASKYHQAKLRRRRVWNAIWHYPWTLLTK